VLLACAVAVADAVAVLWRSFSGYVAVAGSGIDASAGPVAGAVEALNIAGAIAVSVGAFADAIAVALLALFLVLPVQFPIAKLSNFIVEK
jgi:hypothetical protein